MLVTSALVEVNGTQARLRPGAVLGRTSLLLPLQDPRISEAHALVSIREQGLSLLALRGTLAVGGKTREQVVLTAGSVIVLAPGFELRVLQVENATEALAVELLGTRLELPSAPSSVVLAPHPSLRPGVGLTGCTVVLESWISGGEHFGRTPEQGVQALVQGSVLRTAGLDVQVVGVPLMAVDTTVRRADLVVDRFDSAVLHLRKRKERFAEEEWRVLQTLAFGEPPMHVREILDELGYLGAPPRRAQFQEVDAYRKALADYNAGAFKKAHRRFSGRKDNINKKSTALTGHPLVIPDGKGCWKLNKSAFNVVAKG
jgi:hypothetical protein